MNITFVDKSVGSVFTHNDANAIKTTINSKNDKYTIASSGITCSVPSFYIEGFAFQGGAIDMPGQGEWYVGVDLHRKQLRVLPRLGHTGWIPTARVICTNSEILSIDQIFPKVPDCRIPQFKNKLQTGTPTKVVIMGSSLTQSDGGATTWPGMVFGAGELSDYKIPGVVTTVYAGVGGAPNAFQLAQLGLATNHNGYGFNDSGWPGTITDKLPPNGRSELFTGVDLVVIGCLANGGDYRIENIEPLIRKLTERGIEVIIITDNVQGPSVDYTAMSNASLYIDFSEIYRVAELYQIEIADTAAYVFESYIRTNGIGIYADVIHQQSGTPAGPTVLIPANGHEAYARAVRSCIDCYADPGIMGPYTYDFTVNTNDWGAWNEAVLDATSGSLVIAPTASAQGVMLTIPIAVTVGDTVAVTYTASKTGDISGIQLGVQGGGWISNVVAVTMGTDQVVDLTVTQQNSPTGILFYILAYGTGGTLTLDNVSVTITKLAGTVVPTTTHRRAATRSMPPIRKLSDYHMFSDALVILPKNEQFKASSNPVCGTLGAHPYGANSFARKFSSQVGAAEDLLTLTTGQSAIVSGVGVSAFSIIHYRNTGDGATTLGIYMNDGLVNTVTISDPPFANEWYTTILTPTQMESIAGPPSIIGSNLNSVRIAVTAGTVKIAALISFGRDMTYISPDEITYVGTWLPKENSRSGLPGRPTDVVGSYATVKCNGHRLGWVISGNPGTKLCDMYSGSAYLANYNGQGNYHVKYPEPLYGPGDNHIIKCIEANVAGDQANGHALHIGGAIVINDR